MHLVNYIAVCMTCLFDILCFLILCSAVLNFLHDIPLAEIVLNAQFINIFTISILHVFFTMFLCIIAISISKVVLLLAPFWFNAQDQKQLAVWVITSLTLCSIFINLRQVTRDYSDPAFYQKFLDYWGVEHNQKIKRVTNYPEFSFLLTTAVLLHIFSISLEWKMNVYDALNNRIQDMNIAGDNVLNGMIPVPVKHESENSEVASTRALTSVQDQDTRNTAERNMDQEDTFSPVILVQEQVVTVDVHKDEFAAAATRTIIVHDKIINSEDGRINKEDTLRPIIITPSKLSQKSRHNPKKGRFLEVQKKKGRYKVDQTNVSTIHYQSKFLSKNGSEDFASVNTNGTTAAPLNIIAVQAVPYVSMVTELPTIPEVTSVLAAPVVPANCAFPRVPKAQVGPVVQANQVVRVVPAVQVDPVIQTSQVVPVVSTAQVDPVVPTAQVDPVVPAAQVDPVVPAAQVVPVIPAAQVDPVVPAAQVDPVVPAAQVDPEVPAAQVDPVVPAAQVFPVIPAAQVIQVVPAAQVDPVVPAAQVSLGPAAQIGSAVQYASAPTVQYRKLKAFWTFISKGSPVGLWLLVTLVFYGIYWLAKENEQITHYISFLFHLRWILSLILLFPYLILPNQDLKDFVQRSIFNWTRVFCSWSWVPSSVASFVLSRLPD